MRRLVWFFQFLLLLALTFPVAVLPYRASLRFGAFLGDLLFFFWGSRRRIAIENLGAAVARGALTIDGSPEEVIRRNFRNLGKSLAEVIKIYYGLGGRIIRQVEISGGEYLRKAQEKGKGVIFVTGHCGNWELNAIVFSRRLARANIVARPLNNPYINRLVERTRKKYGNRVIYKKGALRKILTSLRRGEVVGILMDQSVIESEGVVAEFLGKKDFTTKMPALIARKTGAPVIPAFITRTPAGHRIELHEAIETDSSTEGDQAVLRDTVRFSSYIENYIRQNPDEWLWIHRRWKRIKE